MTQPQAFSRMDRSFLGAWWWTVDRTMLGSVIALMICGLALVATASPSVAQTIGIPDPYYFLKKHIVFMVPSLLCIFCFSMMSPRLVWRVCSVLFLFIFISLILVISVGDEVKGARRWLSVLGFNIQPSEFIKPVFAVVCAWLLSLYRKNLQREESYQPERERYNLFTGLNMSILLYFLVLALLISQPDLGMSVVLTIVFAIQIFLAGLRFRYLAIVMAIGAFGLGLAYATLHHVRSRVDRFLNPESGDNYQVEKSLEAIRSGGVFGVGPGQGQQKETLPDAHADFIFSVLAEEMGMFFSFILMGLFLYILLRGFRRLRETHDVFSMLAAGGLLTMVGVQSLIHMGSSVNILPAKGMTLPLISYGGSSLLSMGMAFGMVLALTRQKSKTSIAKTTVSMRRSASTLNEKTK
ncbi:MAG: FtsW/RodA/SpoVE family cell cycle protein [Alphaproteobacteria bacterium]